MIDYAAAIRASLPTKEELRKSSIKLYLEAKKNKTCISYWYPKIKSGLPEIKMPETTIVYSSFHDRWVLLDNKTNKFVDTAISKVEEACDKIGYPCFLKDGVFSGKHDWDSTCFIKSKKDVKGHIQNITYSSAMVGCEPSLYIAVREFIKTTPAFYAFTGNMPITCERRYFYEDGKVVFHHPYWPPMSIKKPSVNNWKDLLEELNKESEEEVLLLTELTRKVGNLLGDAWSIDWLKDANGDWWLTDMAEKHKSFIWKEYKSKI